MKIIWKKDDEHTIYFDQIVGMIQQHDEHSLSSMTSGYNIIQQNIPECRTAIQYITDIQEVQQVLGLKFDLEEKWLGSRLQFYNRKPDEEMNTLVVDEKDMIWIPRILFSNTKNDLTSERDDKSFSKVVRNMGL